MRIQRFVRVISVLLALLVVGILFAPQALHDRIRLYIQPSADRAYQMGLTYIDTPDRRVYSLANAEYFFSRAAALDSDYPLVHHQLARIDFLEGRYQDALVHENEEIERMKEQRAAPFYMRGLIAGYLGDYESSARDYATYVSLHPEGWEGRTDYGWALIKTHRYNEAIAVVSEGLRLYPGNGWLLSVRAAALYELGRYEEARADIHIAKAAMDALTEDAWHKAYPGNDPRAAAQGIATLRAAAAKNFEMIERAAGTR